MYKKLKDYEGNATGLFSGIVEVWKDIEGYEGIYQVSSFGEVRSVDRVCTRSDGYVLHFKSKVLKKELKRGEYYTCTLCNVTRKHMFIHRLVALAFIHNSENKKTVNHKDGNKLNNLTDNLEWSTHTEQMKHAVENKLTTKHVRVKFSKEFKQKVQQYHQTTSCSMYELARVFNIDRSSAVRFATGAFNLRKLKVSNDDLPTILELRNKGKTFEFISDYFGCSARYVSQVIERNINKTKGLNGNC